MAAQKHSLGRKCEKLSQAVTAWTGTTKALLLAVGLIFTWIILGPVFGFSNSWQLAINTTTTIITFLMVFLIQRAQNKDAAAIHLKLNELVAAIQGASNRLIDVEALSEQELAALARHYGELAKLARVESDITQSHSVEEARQRHSLKTGSRHTPKRRLT